MNQIKLPETRVLRFTETKIGLNITLELQEIDLTSETRETFRNWYKDGTSLTGILGSVDALPRQQEMKKSQRLHRIIAVASKYMGKTPEEIEKVIKEKNNISHFDDLTEDKLDELITGYKTYIPDDRYNSYLY